LGFKPLFDNIALAMLESGAQRRWSEGRAAASGEAILVPRQRCHLPAESAESGQGPGETTLPRQRRSNPGLALRFTRPKRTISETSSLVPI